MGAIIVKRALLIFAKALPQAQFLEENLITNFYNRNKVESGIKNVNYFCRELYVMIFQINLYISVSCSEIVLKCQVLPN